jgi:hypothetical protein
MKRTTMLLAGLILILVVVGWYLLAFAPRSEALDEIETQILDVQAQQQTTQTRIIELQGVREEAPQLQAELAAGESVLPRETAQPSALRQLQQAADASGATLVSVTPARPVAVEGAPVGLYAMPLNAEVRGGYFQVIDVLRRLEDPSISPRGVVWDSAAITIDETRPDLVVVLSGRMFSVLPAPPATEAPEPGAPDAAETDPDAEVEAEVDATPETEADQ